MTMIQIFICFSGPPCFCPRIQFPICGVDGKNYDNECEAKCVGVKRKCLGPCPCAGIPSTDLLYPYLPKVGMHIFLLVCKPQTASFWVHSAIANLQISEGSHSAKLHILKFIMIDRQITKPEISLMFQSTNCESANLQGKKTMF